MKSWKKQDLPQLSYTPTTRMSGMNQSVAKLTDGTLLGHLFTLSVKKELYNPKRFGETHSASHQLCDGS